MFDLAFETASELLARLRARKIGTLELLEVYIGRVERFDPQVNAVVVHNFDRARAVAATIDEARVRGEDLGPLAGLPMTIKESFHLTGTPTTFGFPEFRDNIATSDAVVVQRLTGAGAVIFGKTNVPPGLMDGQSANEIYGRTQNPWDLTRTPGGSSGGSAAALAAGLTALEMGSDIASSIRNPAHYCGVFGHKPTYGVVPQRGHMLVDTLSPTDIGVVGPLARSAADLELEFDIIAGPAGAEAEAYSLALPKAKHRSIKDHKVALVLDDPFAEVDQAVQDQLDALGHFLAKEGAVVARDERPRFDSHELYILYMILLRAAGSGREPDEVFAEAQGQAKGVDRSTRDIAKANAYGASLSHRDWLRLDEERRRYSRKWREFFERFDLLLCPPLSSAAFPHIDGPPQGRTLRVNGRDVPFENQLFWAGYAGAFHLPASVAPIGLTAEGLPVGVQIIGPQYGDYACLRFAALLEQSYRRFSPPPGY